MKTRKWESLSGISEIDRIKRLAQKILRRLECIVEPTNEEEEMNCKSEQLRLFGDKISLVAAFIMLSEFVLKLDQVDGPAAVEKDAPEQTSLSESDIALVEAFIHKIKNPD